MVDQPAFNRSMMVRVHLGSLVVSKMKRLTYENDTIAGSSNGRTRVFGALYLGSSPSPAAI